MQIITKYARSIPEVIDIALNIQPTDDANAIYFRGENRDFMQSALQPSIYRSVDRLKKEHVFYREMQRFNDHEFAADKTTFDKLARMQHYSAPTRLIDISEDILSAMYFALDGKNGVAALYVIEIDREKIKYYDSDAVCVLSNLAKIPLYGNETAEKSKDEIRIVVADAVSRTDDIDCLNEQEAIKFLLHEIREDKGHFSPIIVPKHIFSIFCVKPKYSNQRILGQKGAFLLFGLNDSNVERPIQLLREFGDDVMFNIDIESDRHPIRQIVKIRLDDSITSDHLSKLGVTKPYIYPELDKVANFLTTNI